MYNIIDKSDFLFKKFFCSKRLSFFERMCLDYFKQGLSSGTVELLERQLEKRIFIFRMLKKKIVCFGYSDIPKKILFPLNTNSEFNLITIKVQSLTDKKNIEVDLLIFKGYVTCIEFHTPPGKFFKKDSEYKLNKLTLHFDPMQPIPSAVLNTEDIKGLPEWIMDTINSNNISELNAPLPEEYRKILLRGIDAVLPDEYLSIIKTVNGLSIKNIDIFKLEEVVQINLPENTFYIFTEIREKGFIAVRKNDKKGNLYLIPHEEPDQAYEIKQSYSRFIR